jgi:hypothetical protein
MFVCALLLAVTGIAPAAAARLYVPALGTAADGSPLTTSVWVANVGGAPRPVAARFLSAEGAGEARNFAVEGGARMLEGLTKAGAVGLIAVDADEAAAVSAWVASGAGDDVREVPVIGPHDSYQAGVELGLDLAAARDALQIGAANLGSATASCQATLLDADGTPTERLDFAVAPLSFGRQAARGLAAAAKVRCDQPFFPVGIATGDDLQVMIAKAGGPNGPCDRWLNLERQPDGSYLATAAGVFHQATSADPKGILCIKAPDTLRVGRAVYDWDVVAGPWWPKKKNGIHNLGYFFGERYRGGVIGNVNTTGTRNTLKFMQNYSMGFHTNTNVSGGYQIEKGSLYHATYSFDANQASANLRFYRNGVEVKNLTQNTFPAGNTLTVSPYGTGNQRGLALVAEFGNYVGGRGTPEVPTIGWTYGNFTLRLFPK